MFMKIPTWEMVVWEKLHGSGWNIFGTSWNWGSHHRFPVSKLRSGWFFRSYENQDD